MSAQGIFPNQNKDESHYVNLNDIPQDPFETNTQNKNNNSNNNFSQSQNDNMGFNSNSNNNSAQGSYNNFSGANFNLDGLMKMLSGNFNSENLLSTLLASGMFGGGGQNPMMAEALKMMTKKNASSKASQSTKINPSVTFEEE